MTQLQELNKQNAELADLRAFRLNRSLIFTRAHYLVRKQYMTLSEALKQCFKEYREYKAKVSVRIDQLIKHIASRFNVEKSNNWNDENKRLVANDADFNPYNKAN